MAEQFRERVGVYIDFDNIVISRYSQLHGRSAWAKDRVRRFDPSSPDADPQIAARITQATVDLGAVLEYASSFGSIVISRAYADWSAAVNAGYQKQLVDRAVDLVQLFPTVLSLKNGADIRLAVDVVEDVFRLDDLTHVVIVAGDSDYIPLAQRCKRLGRYVVGIGVSGATSSSLAAACDEFADYDTLPGVSTSHLHRANAVEPPTETGPVPITKKDAAEPESAKERGSSRSGGGDKDTADDEDRTTPKARRAATALLLRAMELLAKNDLEWQHASSVKNQMRRMDPSFQEQALGYRQFTDFLKSRNNVIELAQDTPASPVMLRLRP